MYYLVGRAFQSQSVFLRAFPVGACRSVVCANNNIQGFTINSSTSRQDYHKWIRSAEPPQPQLLGKTSSIPSLISKRQSSSGDHVTLWTAERILSAALVPLVPLTFAMPNAVLEGVLAFILTLHSHWGIEAIVIDYVRPSIFGSVIPKVAIAAVYGLSALTLGGLLYFIYSDVGLITAIKMLWKL